MNMKKHILILSLFIVGFASSCKKDKTDNFDAKAQAAKDDVTIQAYLTANPSIQAVKDPSGLYYQLITPGTGANPTVASTVTVNYVGKLLNGTQFDTGTYTTGLTAADNVIEGWKYGLLHAKVGGRILLIIPSGLAYGNFAQAGIPANSVLLFTIDLTSFK
jgi:FKBP-type peptidyl-prolyl cis-trans isomerase FkpA